MLRWALIFFIVAIIAGILGFTNIEEGAADIAKTIFFIFIVLVGIFFLLGMTVLKKK